MHRRLPSGPPPQGDRAITAATLPDNPTYCFAPVEDTDTGVWQIRIVVEGILGDCTRRSS